MAEARPSASVILVRDGRAGLETFMVRRHTRSPAFPDAYVFPGGTLHAEDGRFPVPGADASHLARAFSARLEAPLDPVQATAFYICALRELFEEAGVLLVRDALGRVLRVDPQDVGLQERLQSTRLALQARQIDFGALLAEHHLAPAFDLVVPFSHWITPRGAPARFDTRFFVAELPSGQSALHDTIETTEGVWLRPAAALEPGYHTLYPTEKHLVRLSRFGSVAELLTFAREKRIRTVMPLMRPGADGARVAMPPGIGDEDW